MDPAESKMFGDLITKLEQARKHLCDSTPDRFALQSRARLVDETKTLLARAREMRDTSKPL